MKFSIKLNMINKNSLTEVPFQKIKNEQIEFQILDMQKLLKVTTIYEHLESPHRLKFNSIFLITKGEGSHSIDFKTYNYKKGTVLFIAKNQVTSFTLNPDMNCYMIEFTDDFFNRLLKSSIYDIFDYMRYSALLQLDDKSLESILINMQLLTHQLETDVDEFKESIVQSLFQSLLLQLKRKRIEQVVPLKSKDEKVYYDFIQYMRSNHKYTMRVEYYARQLDISSKTLTRILNKYTNKSTKNYLDEHLLLEIKRYLLDDNITLQEIANKLDFDEITNLIKFFKKFEKMTPSEFKKHHQNKIS